MEKQTRFKILTPSCDTDPVLCHWQAERVYGGVRRWPGWAWRCVRVRLQDGLMVFVGRYDDGAQAEFGHLGCENNELGLSTQRRQLEPHGRICVRRVRWKRRRWVRRLAKSLSLEGRTSTRCRTSLNPP